MNFQQKIAEIVRQRQSHLPTLEAEREKIHSLRAKLRSAAGLFREFEANPELAGMDFGGAAELLAVQEESLGRREQDIEQVRRRFERGTINIGVSGQARVGKSTLLQSLSGLADEQIPTGETLEVTAVRSRIFNSSTGAPYALIKFLDEDAFFEKHVQDHLEIFAGQVSWVIPNLDSFAAFAFPETADALSLSSNPQACATSLKRLREAQKALPHFRKLLSGGTKRIDDMNELRAYTAYPTNEEINNQEAVPLGRLYLAVEDMQIFCAFPHEHLAGAALGLIDLPGLGNASKNIDKRHVKGLENGVDHVCVIQNPGQAAYVAGSLVDNIDTICNVQKNIKERGMFASIVVNRRKNENETKVAVLNDAITREINNGVPGSVYTVYTIDAKNPEDVKNFLDQILARLTSELPVMDQEALKACLPRQDQTGEELKKLLEKISGQIDDLSRQIPGKMEQIFHDAGKLRKQLAVSFQKKLDALYKGIGADQNSPAKEIYYKTVNAIKQETEERIKDGLWQGKDWENNAEGEIAVGGGPQGFFEDECHRLRIHIAEKYEELNSRYFSVRLEYFLDEVAALFRENTNTFLPPDCRNRQAIEAVLRKLKSAPHQMKHLEEAFTWLLDLHFDFRQNVFPEIRSALEHIEAYNDKRTPKNLLHPEQIPLERSQVVDHVHKLLETQARMANSEISNQLKRCADAVEKFIYAALEYVDDLVIRNGDAPKEFMNFCEQFRADLWPELYGGVNTNPAQYGRIGGAVKEILAAL